MSLIPVRDDVVELQTDPLQIYRTRVNIHQIIVIQGLTKADAQIEDRIHIAAGLDLFVGVSQVPHQRCTAEFKITKIIGMINHFRSIGIGVQRTLLGTMPDQAGGAVADEPFIAVVNFRLKGLGFHFTLP